MRASTEIKRFPGYLLMLLLYLVTTSSQAQQVWDFYGEPEKGITVRGIVKGEAGGNGGGSVKIYRDGKFYQEVFPGPTGSYEADLPFNSGYELEFSIPGCVTKRIKIETNLPTELQNKTQEPLAFNMSLPKATKGPLDDAYLTPVSRLFFDKSLGDFNRDMSAEQAFRSALTAKQAEQRQWLAEQKAKEDAERQKKREEELAAKKKAEEARLAAEAAAKLKAEQEAAAAKKKAEEEAKRLAELAAQKKTEEDALKKSQNDAFIAKQKEEELRKLAEQRKKQEADSLYKENEKARLAQLAADAEAEKKRKEAEDKALWEKLNNQNAALAEQRRKAIEDSLYIENERKRAEAEQARQEAERLKNEAADAAYASPSITMGGAGKSVYYQVDKPKEEKVIDYEAPQRTENWLRIKRQRTDEYFAKLERRKVENENIRVRETKKQREFLERQQAMEERRRLVAERFKQKEAQDEMARQARLKESLDKKVVVLVAYTSTNSNSKFYGYVNFGDGKGPLELTEAEYKEMAARYNGIYNKP